MSIRKTIKAQRPESGFTLVELMIVVVIIGILAAIAIPQFQKFQLRAQNGEISNVVGGITGSWEGFEAKWGAFPSAAPRPATAPSDIKVNFNAGSGGFALVGYEPSGRVYGQYTVLTDARAASQADPLAWDGSAADAVFGKDNDNFPCVRNGVNGCDAVAANWTQAGVSYLAQADINANGTNCIYAANDNIRDLRAAILTGNIVCGEGEF